MGLLERIFGTKATKDIIAPFKAGYQGFTPIGNTEPICPYCGLKFDKMPQRKKECPNCKKIFYSRTRPFDDKRVLVTNDQVIEVDRQNEIEKGIFNGRQQRVYTDARNEVKAKLGKEPSNYEIMTAFLTKECRYFSSRNDWGLYSNVLLKQAELSTLIGDNKEALTFYLTICYLDLNGPNNIGEIGRTPGIRRFEPEMGFLAPGIIERILKINESLNLSRGEIKARFFDYNRMIHDTLKLPVSLEKAWRRIEPELLPEP
jgi:hypothetical protein